MTHFNKVENFVNAFLDQKLPLHILINNASIALAPLKKIQGIESHWYINFLGHFFLTDLLLPTLKKSAPSRIVNIVSNNYKTIQEGYDINSFVRRAETGYSASKSYAFSKLSMVLMTNALNRRIQPNEKVYVNCVYPGDTKTNLYKNANSLTKVMNQFSSTVVGMSPKEGCLTHLYCATCPDIENFNFRDLYFIPVGRIEEFKGNVAGTKKYSEDMWNYAQKTVSEIIERK